MREKSTLKENLILVAAIVVLVAGVWIWGLKAQPETEFGGSDAAATEALEAVGAEPWFEPVFEPASGELESGLFALQASLGGAILGYAIGALHTRRRLQSQDAKTASPEPSVS